MNDLNRTYWYRKRMKWKMHDLQSLLLLGIKNIFLNAYFWDRERETEYKQGRGRERGRHRTWKQAPGSELAAQRPTWGSIPRAARSWPEPKSDAQLTEPPRCPQNIFFRWCFDFLFKCDKQECDNYVVEERLIWVFLAVLPCEISVPVL